ncbi:MAG: PilZ domain-containing protein [Clostridia bacterium]|nr:PilZ domain-containing protein [Clostridia bacterium]
MSIESVMAILKEGATIGTRIIPDGIWHQNIVYKIENHTVYTSLLESYLENIIMVGSPIIIKLPLEYFEYLYEGTVTEIQPNYPGYVAITIKKAEELVNTRAFPRYDVCLGTDIKSPLNDNIIFSVVSNISLSGMAFVSKETYDYGDVLEIAVYLPNRSIAYAKGKIIRRNLQDTFNSYSMQFVYMDDKNSNLISKYMSTLEKKRLDMQQKYFDSIQKYFL